MPIDINRLEGGACGPAGDKWQRAPLGHRYPAHNSRETHREGGPT